MTIQLNNINKSYDHKTVLQNISLKLDKKFTTILGESGCGKTTLLKIISGLVQPDGGEIIFDDQTVFSDQQKINIPPNQRNLAMVFQDFALWPHMTVFENVTYSLKGKKKEVTKQVMEALRLVNLEEFAERKPGELSGGQQQRVSLARAIAPKPKVILFDEALSALDAVLRERMQTDIVQLLNQTDSQAIFVTHDQNEAMSMSEEIIVMEKGQVSQIGTPNEIYQEPANLYVAHFIGKINQVQDDLFIRPEYIQTSQTNQADSKEQLTVTLSQFTGQHYIIHGKLQQFSWLFYANQPFENGSTCDIYYNKKHLTKIGGNKNEI